MQACGRFRPANYRYPASQGSKSLGGGERVRDAACRRGHLGGQGRCGEAPQQVRSYPLRALLLLVLMLPCRSMNASCAATDRSVRGADRLERAPRAGLPLERTPGNGEATRLARGFDSAREGAIGHGARTKCGPHPAGSCPCAGPSRRCAALCQLPESGDDNLAATFSPELSDPTDGPRSHQERLVPDQQHRLGAACRRRSGADTSACAATRWLCGELVRRTGPPDHGVPHQASGDGVLTTSADAPPAKARRPPASSSRCASTASAERDHSCCGERLVRQATGGARTRLQEQHREAGASSSAEPGPPAWQPSPGRNEWR